MGSVGRENFPRHLVSFRATDLADPCSGFHGPHHGEVIDDMYHDCQIHHEHSGKDRNCFYYYPDQAVDESFEN